MNNSFITRKESIVLSAIEIIDELGIEALSIRTIASRQNVVESSIYKHFKSKEEIILDVVDYFSKYDENIISTINYSSLNAREGIIFFIEALIGNYEAQPALISIVHSFEVMKNSIPAVKVKETYFRRANFINELVEAAKSENVISSSFETDFITTSIIGISKNILIKWRMSNYDFPLKDTAMKYIIGFLNMCKPD